MDTLTKKLNDGLTELSLRAITRTSLVDIERMYGFVLGVIAAMEARQSVMDLLVPKRNKEFWKSAKIPVFKPDAI